MDDWRKAKKAKQCGMHADDFATSDGSGGSTSTARGGNSSRVVKRKHVTSQASGCKELALSISPPLRVTMDTVDDSAADGSKEEGFFYIMDTVGGAYQIDEDLETGSFVIKLKHTNRAVPKRGWYTPNLHTVTVPVEHLLAVNLFMEMATVTRHPGPNAAQLHAYVEQGAVVLSATDRENIMRELRMCKDAW